MLLFYKADTYLAASALEIKLLEGKDKISMMAISGDAWLGSDRGV